MKVFENYSDFTLDEITKDFQKTLEVIFHTEKLTGADVAYEVAQFYFENDSTNCRLCDLCRKAINEVLTPFLERLVFSHDYKYLSHESNEDAVGNFIADFSTKFMQYFLDWRRATTSRVIGSENCLQHDDVAANSNLFSTLCNDLITSSKLIFKKSFNYAFNTRHARIVFALDALLNDICPSLDEADWNTIRDLRFSKSGSDKSGLKEMGLFMQ